MSNFVTPTNSPQLRPMGTPGSPEGFSLNHLSLNTPPKVGGVALTSIGNQILSTPPSGDGFFNSPPKTKNVKRSFSLLNPENNHFNFNEVFTGKSPYKKDRSESTELNKKFVDKVKQINDFYQIQPANGGLFALTAIQGAKGQHSQAYQLAKGAEPLYADIQNEQIIIKTYHLESRVKLLDDEKLAGKYYAKNSLKQYGFLKANQFPIAKIYNEETVLADGFFAVEKVTPFLQSGRTEDMEVWQAILEMFFWAGSHPYSIPIDLSPGNIGINEEGRLVLFDFMEHEEDDDGPNPFMLSVGNHIDNFAKECGSALREFLNHEILTTEKPENQALKNSLENIYKYRQKSKNY